MNRINREIRNNLMITAFKEGVSTEEIAEQHHIKRGLVLYILRKSLGDDYILYIKKKVKKVRNKDRNILIVTEFKEDRTLTEIGERFNISRERVRQILVNIMGDEYEILKEEKLKQKLKPFLDKFIEYAKELDRIPRLSEYITKKIGSNHKYQELKIAASAIGFKYIRKERKRIISNNELIIEIKSLAVKLGRTPSKSDLYAYKPKLRSVYHIRFGSLNNAIKLANLEPNKRGYNKFTYRRGPLLITKQQCIDDLKKIYSQFGRKPTWDEVRTNGIYSISTYTKYLGAFDQVWEK